MSFKCADDRQYANTNGWRYEWQLPAVKGGVALTRHDADRIIIGAKKKGITLLAVGFDNTFVHVHTALYRNALDGPKTFSAWGGDASQLALYARPMLRALISSAIRHGLHVAVVTLCDQNELVRQVLHTVSGETEIILKAGHGIPGVDHHLVPQGKQRHIQQCIDHIQSMSGNATAMSEVLLIDDDQETMQIAGDAGCKFAWLPTAVPNIVQTSNLFDGNTNKWCEAYLLQNLRMQYAQ